MFWDDAAENSEVIGGTVNSDWWDSVPSDACGFFDWLISGGVDTIIASGVDATGKNINALRSVSGFSW